MFVKLTVTVDEDDQRLPHPEQVRYQVARIASYVEMPEGCLVELVDGGAVCVAEGVGQLDALLGVVGAEPTA